MYSIMCSMNKYELLKKNCSFQITKAKPILRNNKTGI